MAQARVPVCNLAIVLEGLSLAPSKPVDAASAKCITFKITLLLAITFIKRLGDLQALSVAFSCLELKGESYSSPKTGLCI